MKSNVLRCQGSLELDWALFTIIKISSVISFMALPWLGFYQGRNGWTKDRTKEGREGRKRVVNRRRGVTWERRRERRRKTRMKGVSGPVLNAKMFIFQLLSLCKGAMCWLLLCFFLNLNAYIGAVVRKDILLKKCLWTDCANKMLRMAPAKPRQLTCLSIPEIQQELETPTCC